MIRALVWIAVLVALYAAAIQHERSHPSYLSDCDSGRSVATSELIRC